MARISSKYGPRKLFGRTHHNGVDYATPIGTPIYSTKQLTVNKVGYQSGYGNVIYAVDNNGVEHRFGHLDSIPDNIKPGKQISPGEKFAHTGNTGDSTGAHLHFEVRQNGRHFDPLKTIDPLTGKSYDAAASFTANGQSMSSTPAKKDPTYKPQARQDRPQPFSKQLPPLIPLPNSTSSSPMYNTIPPKIETSINPLLQLGDE